MLGKLSACEDKFFCLVWPLRREVFLFVEVQFQKFCSPVKTSSSPAENHLLVKGTTDFILFI